MAQIAGLNEWAILSVANDPSVLLPTGAVASDVLRSAWDAIEGTFYFREE